MRESLEMAVKDDWEEIVRNELGCEKISYALQLRWDGYIYSAESHCHDTTSEDWEIYFV
jgi:hypothetical protein